jgi:hypothetical protein
MNRERRGVVIGVSAFVWMRKDNVGPDFVDEIRDVEDELEHLETRFTIDVPEPAAAFGRYAEMRESVHDFAAASTRVLFARLESLALSVAFVAGRTIGYVRDDDVRKIGKEAARTDCLVVRMRDDNERVRKCRRDRLTFRDAVQDFARDFGRQLIPGIVTRRNNELGGLYQVSGGLWAFCRVLNQIRYYL